MPRERIQHGKLLVEPSVIEAESAPLPAGHVVREFDPDKPLAADEVIREQQSVDLAWNRDAGWVQLVIEAPADWWQRVHSDASWEGSDVRSVASEPLTRQQINHLIRTLRRARDAAFGADE